MAESNSSKKFDRNARGARKADAKRLSRSPSKKTPLCNTGVNLTKTGKHCFVDWLAGSFPVESLGAVQRLVGLIWTSEVDFLPSHGLRHYESSLKTPYGVVIGLNQRKGSYGSNGCLLECPGSSLALLSQHQVRLLIKELYTLGFKSSRIDLSIDDYDKTFTPQQVEKAYHKSNIKGFRNTGRMTASGEAGNFAYTFSLGRRGSSGSGKRVTFYDKYLESKGEIDAIRTELSLYGKYSREACKIISTLDTETFPEIVFGYVSWAVDFIDRTKDSNVSRCPRLRWWKKFMSNKATFYMENRPVKKSLERVKDWLEHQVFPSFYALIKAYNQIESGQQEFHDWFVQKLRQASGRLSDRHYWMIEQFVSLHSQTV